MMWPERSQSGSRRHDSPKNESHHVERNSEYRNDRYSNHRSQRYRDSDRDSYQERGQVNKARHSRHRSRSRDRGNREHNDRRDSARRRSPRSPCSSTSSGSHRNNQSDRKRQLDDPSKQITSFPDCATTDDISPIPSNCLLVRGLDPSISEETVLEVFGSLTGVAIKSIKILRDGSPSNRSRGLCLVELYSISETYQLHHTLTSMDSPFTIKGGQVIVSFGRKPQAVSAPISNSSAACAALAAAQWNNHFQPSTQTQTSPAVISAPPTIHTAPQPSLKSPVQASQSKWEMPEDNELGQQHSSDQANKIRSETLSPPTGLKLEKTCSPPPIRDKFVSSQPSSCNQSASLTVDKMQSILKQEEDKLVNFECLACLLCKRTFKSRELLTKHRNLSELHKTSLAQLKKTLFTQEQIEDTERKEREANYRDRAKERRQKYGTPADIDNPLKDRYLSAGPSNASFLQSKLNSALPSTSSVDRPIESDNVGAKLLSKMGWQEGLGIGKSNQGMTDIIKVEARTKNAGLGTKKSRIDPHISYKDAVRLSMYERYKELSEEN